MKVDLIVRNARIDTRDAAHPKASSLAILHGRIVAIDADVDGLQARETLDLGGLPVLAGFNDVHAHSVWFGTTLIEADLFAVASHDDIYAAIERQAQQTAPGEWVVAAGYNPVLLGSITATAVTGTRGRAVTAARGRRSPRSSSRTGLRASRPSRPTTRWAGTPRTRIRSRSTACACRRPTSWASGDAATRTSCGSSTRGASRSPPCQSARRRAAWTRACSMRRSARRSGSRSATTRASASRSPVWRPACRRLVSPTTRRRRRWSPACRSRRRPFRWRPRRRWTTRATSNTFLRPTSFQLRIACGKSASRSNDFGSETCCRNNRGFFNSHRHHCLLIIN